MMPGFMFVDKDDNVEPFKLSMLKGATLTWEDGDGNTRSVKFDNG